MHAMTVSDVNIAPLRLVRNKAIPITHLQVPKLSYPFQNIMYMHYRTELNTFRSLLCVRIELDTFTCYIS